MLSISQDETSSFSPLLLIVLLFVKKVKEKTRSIWKGIYKEDHLKSAVPTIKRD